MPDDFEAMFMSMARSVGEQVAQDDDHNHNNNNSNDQRNDYLYNSESTASIYTNNNDDVNNNNQVIESINEALSNFSSQLDLMSSREKDRSYNLNNLQKSLTVSGREFLQLEKEIADRHPGSSQHSEQSEDTVVLAADATNGMAMREVLSNSIADREREALLQLRKEIEGEAEVEGGVQETTTTTVTTTTKMNTNTADLRNRARARMLARSGRNNNNNKNLGGGERSGFKW